VKRTGRGKNKHIIAGIVMVFVICSAVFVGIRITCPQRNHLLVGRWEHMGWANYTMILNANGSGSVEPDIPSFRWRVRNGQFMQESMGVELNYEYEVCNTRLILHRIGRDGRLHMREYVRVNE